MQKRIRWKSRKRISKLSNLRREERLRVRRKKHRHDLKMGLKLSKSSLKFLREEKIRRKNELARKEWDKKVKVTFWMRIWHGIKSLFQRLTLRRVK